VQVSHIENSPNSLAEAMLLGMPCIASFAGGTSSLLENYKEGILYQDGDPYYLTGLILKLINNEKKRKIYSQNAREKAQVRHEPDKIYSKLKQSYEDIIEHYNNKTKQL
jgi:glycosyltransferase involved in cell wall biosynthesis